MWNGSLGNCPACQFTPFHEPFSHIITIIFLANTSNYHYIFFCSGKWPANPRMFFSNINETTSMTNFCISPAPWCWVVGLSPHGACLQTEQDVPLVSVFETWSEMLSHQQSPPLPVLLSALQSIVMAEDDEYYADNTPSCPSTQSVEKWRYACLSKSLINCIN